jgi:glycerol-3-phosphate dehydrogenase
MIEEKTVRTITQDILDKEFDVIIIGGGINGAGLARDAAERGLSVILLEKGDFASGTTSYSTRLIHGGLRYLEHFEFQLVRESLRERETLLRIAPHLVRPLPLVIPIYKDSKRGYAEIKIGMSLYDMLSYNKSLESHKMLKREEIVEAEPNIKREGLVGAAIYYDCQVVFPERMCLENIFSAQERGALVLNYTEVTDVLVESHSRKGRMARFRKEKRAVKGVQFRDLLTGNEYEVRGKVIVNVSGPWVDELCKMVDKKMPRKIGGTKGSHLVVPSIQNGPTEAMYVVAEEDGRPFFIIPWRAYSLIGTTDTRYEGDLDEVVASDWEIDYLIRETNRVLPKANMKRSDIHYVYSGVRPLPFIPKGEERNITRRHIIHDHEKHDKIKRFISIIGGKLTTYRSLADETMDVIYKKLRRRFRSRRRCKTAKLPLFGGAIGSANGIEEYINANLRRIMTTYNVSESVARHLISFYGSRCETVLMLTVSDPSLKEPICELNPDITAQVVYAVEREMAVTLADVLIRRTGIGASACLGLNCAEKAAAVMGKHLHWTNERRAEEVGRYKEYVNKFYKVQ